MLSPLHSPGRVAAEESARTKLLRNAGWLIIDRGVRFVVVFATGILVTRHLGPSDTGILGNALALAAVLGGLCDLGLDSIVRMQVIKAPVSRGTFLGTALGLRLLAAPVAFGVFAAALAGGPPGTTGVLIAGVGLTLLAPAALIFDSWFHSQTQARYSVWGQTAALFLGATLRAGGVVAGASLAWFGWVAGIEAIAMGLLLLLVYRCSGENLRAWRFESATARSLLARSWSLALTNLAILLYTRIDVVLLSHLRGAHETGLYAAVVRLTEVGYILPMILVNTLFPLLTRQHAEDPAAFLLTLRRLLTVVAGTGVATAATLALGAPLWIRILYGAEFAAAAPALTLGAWTCILAGLGAVRAQWLLLHGLQHYGLYYVGLGALLNLALNLWLIPALGAVGAAGASLATQTFIIFVAPLFFAPTRPTVVLLLRAFLPVGLIASRQSPPSV